MPSPLAGQGEDTESDMMQLDNSNDQPPRAQQVQESSQREVSTSTTASTSQVHGRGKRSSLQAQRVGGGDTTNILAPSPTVTTRDCRTDSKHPDSRWLWGEEEGAALKAGTRTAAGAALLLGRRGQERPSPDVHECAGCVVTYRTPSSRTTITSVTENRGVAKLCLKRRTGHLSRSSTVCASTAASSAPTIWLPTTQSEKFAWVYSGLVAIALVCRLMIITATATACHKCSNIADAGWLEQRYLSIHA